MLHQADIFQLPVSGLRVSLREPTGDEDLLLVESSRCDAAVVLELIRRLAAIAPGDRPLPESSSESSPESRPWGGLTITDADVLLLRLRQLLSGNLIRSDTRCGGCGEWFEVAFGIDGYIEHHLPKKHVNRAAVGEIAWERLAGTTIEFRPPTVADCAAAAQATDPERELFGRCLRRWDGGESKQAMPAIPAAHRRRAEAAMYAAAPGMDHVIDAACPRCGGVARVHFDPQQFCLREMRDAGAYVFADVALLANRFHWTETAILALPRSRRARYAEMALA